MREFADVEAIDDLDRESACLALAFFSNLVAGLEYGHVKPASARHVVRTLTNLALDYLIDTSSPTRKANDFSDLHVDMLLSFVTEVMQRDLDSSHFMTRPLPAISDGDSIVISLQPSWAFKFWLDAAKVHEVHVADHSWADVAVLCREFLKPSMRSAGAAVGERHNVVWVTPYKGQVRDVVDECTTKVVERREYSGTAARMRELLGLIDRRPGEQAVIAYSRATLGTMEREDRVRLSAPTVLDARGYKRFRHWPTQFSTSSDDGFGRTYDLNANKRLVKRHEHGAPEVVRRKLLFSDIERFEYIGRIAEMDGESEPEWASTAAREFAEEVSDGRTLIELLTVLEAYLVKP
ncbi:hypothetical protein EON80_20675 [bacterium]|nr:MAG: hypothetical protein EON80_20675 [bacterium]